jgi:hypothetical protein
VICAGVTAVGVKMETAGFSEIPLSIYQTSRRHIPGDRNPDVVRSEGTLNVLGHLSRVMDNMKRTDYSCYVLCVTCNNFKRRMSSLQKFSMGRLLSFS